MENAKRERILFEADLEVKSAFEEVYGQHSLYSFLDYFSKAD
jgi:hypothetical protein